MIRHDPYKIVESELAEGEKLIWADHPHGVVADIPTTIISLILLAVLGVFFRNDLVEHPAYIMFGGVLLLSVMWWALMPLFEYYGITQSRLLIVRTIIFGDTISLRKKNIKSVKVVRRSGVENIRITVSDTDYGFNPNQAANTISIGPFRTSWYALHGVRNSPEVLALINNLGTKD